MVAIMGLMVQALVRREHTHTHCQGSVDISTKGLVSLGQMLLKRRHGPGHTSKLSSTKQT